jgi:hypothetical protein
MLALNLSEYEPVNDIYLLEIDSPKVKESEFDQTTTGIFIQSTSVVDSIAIMGTIKKMGPNCNRQDYKVGDIINYYPEAGLDIIFEDEDNKFILIGDEKFLGKLTPKTD